MEKDAFYFPHFSNARNDKKLKRARKELGIEGYGIFFMLLEILREESDFKYPLKDIDLLADDFGTSEQKVRTIIANYELFEVDIEQRFFSSKFIEFLQPYIHMKEQRRIAGIKSGEVRRAKTLNLIENEQPFNGSSTVVQRELNENEQSKVNKVKENIYSTDFLEFFSLYPRKEGKSVAYKSWQKQKPLLSDVLQTLSWQKQSDQWKKEGGQFIPMASTYINQRRWEDQKPENQTVKNKLEWKIK